MNVAYLGPLKDYSGYGEANRHAVAALDAAGVNVLGQLVSYSQEAADFGSIGRLVDEMCQRRGKYNIQILHTTPDQYIKLMEPDKYHIAHFFWETDRVPDEFAAGLNKVDEIWTGSEANKQALLNSGVERPIYIYPQAIETDRTWPKPYQIPEFDGFLFLSIFEWTDRKNPEALLKAFWEEFQGQQDVGLLIKTYFTNFTLSNRRMIRNQIALLKSRFGGEKAPPVFLYLDLMDRQQIMRLHMTGDAYVSAHRGEGWGVPQVEAALAGKPIISTGWGGCHEYFESGTNALLLPYEMQKLRGMSHSSRWYNSEQNWAEVNPDALRGAMRWVYKNRAGEAAIMGLAGQKQVQDKFNLKTVGRMMADRLKQIEEEL
jgi:glycosyltransferase involved in cell wall biosynthesis